MKQIPTAAPLPLPQTGFLRQSQIIPALVPISSATFWHWVKAGKFPAPVRLSKRITAWRAEDIRARLDSHAANGGSTP